MKTKKSANANLETRRSIFRQMGLLLALGFLFIAFEYANTDVAYNSYEPTSDIFVELDHVPVTRPEPPQLPPSPPVFIYELLVIDDDIPIPDDIAIIIDMDEVDDVTIFDIPEPEEVDPDRVFFVADKMPEFPGGTSALMKYLQRQVRYPAMPQELGIQGRVYVQFVVNKKGEIVDVKIMKGVDRYLDEEALRVVKNMPPWKPGEQSGKAVNVSFQLPINFKLRN